MSHEQNTYKSFLPFTAALLKNILSNKYEAYDPFNLGAKRTLDLDLGFESCHQYILAVFYRHIVNLVPQFSHLK